MRRSFKPTLVGSVACVLSLCAGAAPASSRESEDPYASCRQTSDPDSCFDRIEAGLLRRMRGRADRNGRQLRVHPSGGQPVILTDEPEAEEQFVRFRYRAYLSGIGQHLIEVHLYEGHGFWLVDASTGRLTKLMGVPVASPDRSRFVAASMDLDAGYTLNALEVWHLAKEGPEREFQLNAGWAWGPSDPVWRDDHTIEFRKNVPAQSSGRPVSSQARLVLGPAGWALQEAPAGAPNPR